MLSTDKGNINTVGSVDTWGVSFYLFIFKFTPFDVNSNFVST